MFFFPLRFVSDNKIDVFLRLLTDVGTHLIRVCNQTGANRSRCEGLQRCVDSRCTGSGLGVFQAEVMPGAKLEAITQLLLSTCWHPQD